MIRLLKLSINKDEILSSEDILSIHLGYFLTHGKVAYSTDVAVAEKPEYVLLTIGNVEDICYVCKVENYAYKDNIKAELFSTHTPDVYKDKERKTWLLFNSMQKISVDFLDELLSDNTVKDFIKQRSNNKILI
ncbi:MAG: hypothetical protein ACI4F2_02820 [Acutalibacteraceae bacterium]